MSAQQWSRRLCSGVLAFALVCLALPAAPALAQDATTAPSAGQYGTAPDETSPTTGESSLIFFVADGLRQDIVEGYAAQGFMPAMGSLIANGAKAADNGLLTQAPPNTGAGWFTLATGAWPAVAGSTNNTFHINGSDFSERTSAFDEGVLQAETLAQAAERGGKRVVQIEWVGGRNGAINGPTVDYRKSFSGRGVATNYISPTDDESFIKSSSLQFDHPHGFAGKEPFAGAALVDAAGWSNVPDSFSPAQEMRLRVLDSDEDKYGFNAYIFDSTEDDKTNYDHVLFDADKDASSNLGVLKRGQWADIKVRIVSEDEELNGKTAGMLVKVEELTPDLSKVRLFHTAVTRAVATWADWPGAIGFSGDFAEFVAQRFPTSTAADNALAKAGIVSEETYVQQALYWEDLYLPLIAYILRTYQPDLAMVGYPNTDEFQHQFMGLVTKTLPGGAPNPAFDDAQLDGEPDGQVSQRAGYLKRVYMGADETLALVQWRMPDGATTFVSSDHGFAPQFLAIDASKVLVDLGLLSSAQSSNCRTADDETIGAAKACWAAGSVQIYLNVTGRDPATETFQQIDPGDVDATVARIKAAFLGLSDENDWTGDGAAEGWQLIDRAYTKAEARYIPNGDGSTADMANPTRTGDLVVFAYPPYQFDSPTPGTLVAPSTYFGQHGYVPDVQDLDANVNMRAAFLAGGDLIAPNVTAKGVRSIDLAPTAAYLLDVPAPQQAQGVVRLDLIKGGDDLTLVPIVGLTDFHGQLEQTTALMDGISVPVGGAAQLATMFDEEAAAFGDQGFLLASGDNVGASPANSGLLDDMPAIDVENAWAMDATSFGNHEFDYGVDALKEHLDRASFPFLGANIVDEATGENPDWVQATHVLEYGDLQIGVIGIGLENTPDLVSAGATEGIKFLPATETIKTESAKLAAEGIHIQVVLIHEGAAAGGNALEETAPVAWNGPIVDIVSGIQDTTVDLVLAGHTHRVADFKVGHITVSEGLNAGASYSVAQLIVDGDDVTWAGVATRVAKNIGVAGRTDVQAIVNNANDITGVLRNQVIGAQQFDILRDPNRLSESTMGNMVADAMRAKYPGVDAAYTNSGGLRADLPMIPPSAGEASGELTWGEVFSVLPFGNRTILLTLTGAQLEEAYRNGLSPVCNPDVATGRFPQISGLRVTFKCDGATPVVTGMWKTPAGMGGSETPIATTDSVRVVTNDFMYSGGDGYAVFTQASDVAQPGDDLLQVTIDYISANSPVRPVVDGRIVQE